MKELIIKNLKISMNNFGVIEEDQYKPKIFLYLGADWGVREDLWRKYSEIEKNKERHQYYFFRIYIGSIQLELELKGKKVGEIYYGRDLSEEGKLKRSKKAR